MTPRDWIRWLNGLPRSVRWFVLIIPARPVVDNFYFLKDISPFLSPLYVLGVAVPAVIVMLLVLGVLPRTRGSALDAPVAVWGALLALNAVALLTLDVSVGSAEIAIKLVTPALLYLFARHLVRSERDLVGVVTAFLYGTVVPFGMLLYERLFGAVGKGVIETRQFERYEGLYADVMSYAIYVVMGLTIAAFFYLRWPTARRGALLGGVFALSVVGLLSMHHAASWVVAGVICALYVAHIAGSRQFPALILVAALGLGTYAVTGDAIDERLVAMFEKDLSVLEGEADTDRAFHGRASRWKYLWGYWEDLSVLEQAGGVALGEQSQNMLGYMLLSGSHSDYFRALFSTGALGLLAFLGIWAAAAARALGKDPSGRFLVLATTALMMLYSVSTTPSLYLSLTYVVMPILAFAALPRAGRGPEEGLRRGPAPPRRAVLPSSRSAARVRRRSAASLRRQTAPLR